MMFVFLLISLFVVLGILGFVWVSNIGTKRALLAIFFRCMWLVPLLSLLFPKDVIRKNKDFISQVEIPVLIDDSKSMKQVVGGESYLEKANTLVNMIDQKCLKIGCKIKRTYLSQGFSGEVENYTPLSGFLNEWLLKVKGKPWILLSDGADQNPTVSWNTKLSSYKSELSNMGIFIAFDNQIDKNIWIDDVVSNNFSFVDSQIHADVYINRNYQLDHDEVIQVQVLSDEDKVIATKNIIYQKEDLNLQVEMVIPSLRKGRHYIKFRVVPKAEEKIVWDNDFHKNFEVLVNTVGVLHLLGHPSWDGRFLRRYLKSEPKYETISFFILRDPWDKQEVDERDLSLIPFPVERLFGEELVNFKLLVLQNFSMVQFLRPEQQKNLVNFVKNGGGLLFIGGDRSLYMSELHKGPISEIVPFQWKSDKQRLQYSSLNRSLPSQYRTHQGSKRDGPWFDKDLSYSINMASPTQSQRQLASIYDDLNYLSSDIESLASMKGLHHLEKAVFDMNVSTPLLEAKIDGDKTLPLAYASYPGKGRAVWLFTDSLWNIAFEKNTNIPRSFYNKLFDIFTSWLLREELRKPLFINDFKIYNKGGRQFYWSSKLQGPASKYLFKDRNWKVKVCDILVDNKSVQLQRLGNNQWHLESPLNKKVVEGEKCRMSFFSTNKAYGSISESSQALYPPKIEDDFSFYSEKRVQDLARVTRSKLIVFNSDYQDKIDNWLDKKGRSNHIFVNNTQNTKKSYYWLFNSWYLWFFIIFLPLEVLVRRWHKIFVL